MTTDEAQKVGDQMEAAINEETSKIRRIAHGQTPSAAEPSRVRTAMVTVDARGERDERAIEALIEQAVALRVMQVRGKLSFGHADMLARKRALEWVMTIGASNAEVTA